MILSLSYCPQSASGAPRHGRVFLGRMLSSFVHPSIRPIEKRDGWTGERGAIEPVLSGPQCSAMKRIGR